MSIPLVQKAEKDDINTSIIAIKRNIERINMLLGLVDSGGSDPDLSGLATKAELQDAVTELQPVDEVTIDNMQSVTSNAVASAMSYSTTEHKTGRYWTDGRPTYEIMFEGTITATTMRINHGIANIGTLVNIIPRMVSRDGTEINSVFYSTADYYFFATATKTQLNIRTGSYYLNNYKYRVTLEYTKTTD